MRKLQLEMQVSLDGFVAARDKGMRWCLWEYVGDWTWDKELQKYHTDMTASIDTVLLGWQMAEGGFIDHWARIAGDTGNPQATFAGHVTRAKKIIFSRQPRTPRWENAEMAKGDLVTTVNQLKQQDGKDLIVYGGVAFVSALVGAGLIDEYHFIVNPTAIGQGESIFKTMTGPLHLSLQSARQYTCGITVLVYSRPLI